MKVKCYSKEPLTNGIRWVFWLWLIGLCPIKQPFLHYTKDSWQNCWDSLHTAPLRKQYTSNDYLWLQDTGVSTTCFILTLKNLCRYCFAIGGMWLMHWNSVVVSHMRGGAVFVLYGQVMWAEYSKLYGWHIIHLHECSQNVMCNADPANHLKEDKVGHCMLFIWMTKSVLLYLYSLYFC